MGKLSVTGPVLLAIAASSCSVAPVTFSPLADASTDAAGPGADANAIDAALAPASCRAIHDASPGLPSGTYEIDPDGAGGAPPMIAACDMATDGGGWTIVFLAQTTNFTEPPLQYTGGTPRLLADAESVLLAYRSSAQVSAPGHARFALPAAWRSTPPFDAVPSDLPIAVSVDGGAPVTATLRYGRDTFSRRCADPWIPTVTWGRICIVGVPAPFYAGFAHVAADTCTSSLAVYDETACTDERRFSIAVR